MAYLFNIFLIVSFLLFQTSVAPRINLFNDFVNLFSLFLIYLLLYRPVKEIIIFVLLSGLIMDAVSSNPFGLFLTTYIWLALGIKLALRYLHSGNVIFVPLIISSVILAENLIIIIIVTIIEQKFILNSQQSGSIIIQIVYGALIGPFLIILIKDLQARWNIWSFEKIFKHFG